MGAGRDRARANMGTLGLLMQDKETGISIRFIREYDPSQDAHWTVEDTRIWAAAIQKHVDKNWLDERLKFIMSAPDAQALLDQN